MLWLVAYERLILVMRHGSIRSYKSCRAFRHRSICCHEPCTPFFRLPVRCGPPADNAGLARALAGPICSEIICPVCFTAFW